MSLIPFDAIELACDLCPEIADNLDLFEDFAALTGGELTTKYKSGTLRADAARKPIRG
jgi:hypothetical protein